MRGSFSGCIHLHKNDARLYKCRWFGIWKKVQSFAIGMSMGIVLQPVPNCAVIFAITCTDFLLVLFAQPYTEALECFSEIITTA